MILVCVVRSIFVSIEFRMLAQRIFVRQEELGNDWMDYCMLAQSVSVGQEVMVDGGWLRVEINVGSDEHGVQCWSMSIYSKNGCSFDIVCYALLAQNGKVLQDRRFFGSQSFLIALTYSFKDKLSER